MPIPGYKLEKFLGRGNFGEVWQALSPGGTRSALKFLNLREQHGRKEFRAIQRLKQIRHAHLMPINAMWLLDANGNVLPDELDLMQPLMEDTVRRTMLVSPSESKPAVLVMAMPLAERNLMEVLKEQKSRGESGLPVESLLSYMLDAAKAIDFLNAPRHDLGGGNVAIQHGDVKPENLVLVGESIVLCDFGVARTLGPSTDTRGTTLGGSLAYMAPECLVGQSTATSDQFSLAVSYVELRTGELPFEESSVTEVIDLRRKGWMDLSKLPPAEQSVIKRATHLKADQRYPTTVAMVEDLMRAVRGEPGKAFPWLPFTLATATIAGLAIAAVFFWPKGSGSTTIGPGPKNGGNDPPVVNWRDRYADFVSSAQRSYLDPEQRKTAEDAFQFMIDHQWTPTFPSPEKYSPGSSSNGVDSDRMIRSAKTFIELPPSKNLIGLLGADWSSISLRKPEAWTTEIGSLAMDDVASAMSIRDFRWLDDRRMIAACAFADQHKAFQLSVHEAVGDSQSKAERMRVEGDFHSLMVPKTGDWLTLSIFTEQSMGSTEACQLTWPSGRHEFKTDSENILAAASSSSELVALAFGDEPTQVQLFDRADQQSQVIKPGLVVESLMLEVLDGVSSLLLLGKDEQDFPLLVRYDRSTNSNSSQNKLDLQTRQEWKPNVGEIVKLWPFPSAISEKLLAVLQDGSLVQLGRESSGAWNAQPVLKLDEPIDVERPTWVELSSNAQWAVLGNSSKVYFCRLSGSSAIAYLLHDFEHEVKQVRLSDSMVWITTKNGVIHGWSMPLLMRLVELSEAKNLRIRIPESSSNSVSS